jgi:lipopolysaccharide/colanic/teichoic acid biosynthesis glycosyltransferase
MIMPSANPPSGLGAGDGGLALKAAPSFAGPTIWGLDPFQLHDRFWASHGVQVVRQGDSTAPGDDPVHEHAPFYLLMEPRALAVFDPAPAEAALSRVESELLYVRVHDTRERGGREHVVTDHNNRFVRFQRVYDRPQRQLARAALTREIRVARAWQSAPSPREGWRILRRHLIPKSHRSTLESQGMLYDGFVDQDVAAFVRDLTRSWNRPDCTVGRARRVSPGVWQDRDAAIDPLAKLVGPVWIGAGRRADSGTMIVGPAILWDEPGSRPSPDPVPWETAPWRNVLPSAPPQFRAPEPAILQSLAQARKLHNFFKRGFDVVFSLFALCLTLPIYPFIMLAIVLEDGWPIFFTHRRETIGGCEFPCIKFRSMRKDAEKMKAEIKERNQADGPQFYMENDPRLTRVGKLIRKFRLDEFPQFFNVLVGHMSVVGPRPSPFSENQYCPAWREVRLSVRPGITGLWQIKRTRQPGTDFQEWIRYDIEYVENASWSLDLLIIWKTIVSVIRGKDEAPKSPPKQ